VADSRDGCGASPDIVNQSRYGCRRILRGAAVDAWREEDEVAPESETPEQRTARLRAWTLALIGSIVSERGRREGNEVVVPMTDDVIDAAITAADEPLG